MPFSISAAGFAEFITRPFTNPVGWIFLIIAAVWIYLRLKGKVGGIKTKQERKGRKGPDYTT